MQNNNRDHYTIAGDDVIAQGTDLKVSILTLSAGQCVPWHHHSNVSDRFFCMEGPMVVETRAPRAIHVLRPGETCMVPPMTAHYVHGQNDGPCRFMIVQGVGVYDYILEK
jgi:quercetin dioxygenase-like cupin family protein